MADPKLANLALSLSKIQHKKYELYVLTRIVHQLDHNIKCVFQQYVQRDKQTGNYALIDLYLPDLKIAIEVDEDYHLGQLSVDDVREQDIMKLDDNIQVKRINCTKDLAEIDKQIDEVVAEIKQVASGKALKWDGLTGYEHYRNTMLLDINDTTELSSPSEICNCFGLGKVYGGGSRRVHRNTPNQYTIWWAKEHSVDKNGIPIGEWYNKIENDGDIIIEYRLKPELYKNGTVKTTADKARQDHCNEVWKEEGKNKIPRLAFYRKKSAIGGELFRFMGVYTVSIVKHKEDGKDCCKWTRISGKFELPEYYRPNNLLHDLQILKQGLGSLPGNKLVQRKRKEIEETRAKIEELVNNFNTRDIYVEIDNWYNKTAENDLFKPFAKDLKSLYDKKSNAQLDYENYVEREIRQKWNQAKELELNVELSKYVNDIFNIRAFILEYSQQVASSLELSYDNYGKVSEEVRKKAESIINKYRNNPTGSLAEFVKKCESSARLEENGLSE